MLSDVNPVTPVVSEKRIEAAFDVPCHEMEQKEEIIFNFPFQNTVCW